MLGLSLLLFAPLTLYTAASLARGTRLAGGYRRLCAYMRTKGRGTPSATFTVYRHMGAECNSWSVRGTTTEAAPTPFTTLPAHRLASSSTAPGSSISVTGARGGSGGRLGGAGSDE